ncbi:MAG: LysR family transcriptional regulator [Pseudomonadota bacterium]
MKSLPPLTWFRTFDAAARHLSFTAAAQEIGLTQSAVSQQVKALETHLNVTLFVRRARGLALTDQGRRLLPQIGTALKTLQEATRPFVVDADQPVLTVATSVSVAQWVILPNLATFAQAHPEVAIRFISTIWPDEVQTTRADVEIRFGSAAQIGHNALPLEPAELIAVAARDLTGPLTELPLIEAVGTSDGWQSWAERIGTAGQPRFFADSFGMALQMAVDGVGVALISRLLAASALNSGRMRQVHPASLTSQDGYYMAVEDKHPAAGLFAEWVRSLT